MSEAVTSSGAGLRRVKFRCSGCGAPIIAELSAGPAPVRCSFCGRENQTPTGRPRPAASAPSINGSAEELRIPPRVAHESYLNDLRVAFPSAETAGTGRIGERTRMRRRQRAVLIALAIGNAAAIAAGVVLLSSGQGWW